MTPKLSYLRGLIWAVILFLLPLPLIQALALGLPSIYAGEAFAIQLGSIAYVWWLAAVYLATRPRWLDRLIGLPSLYFIHGLLSLLALVLAYFHKTQTSSFGWIKRTGDWAFDLFVALMAYSLIFLAGWLTSRSRLLTRLKRQLERLFHHELSIWLHRLNLVALALVFVHVQLIGYVTSITSYIWLFNGYTIVVAGAYLYQKITHVWRLPAAKLTAKRKLAPNFYEFTLQVRHPHQLTVHLFVNFPHHDGLKERHPFSVVNAVSEDGQIVLAIRGDGDFTRQI
ncbi:iron reductase [Levilactobacillus zymae]|uniref:iron reductase n=1 Tax=Levilactobacillus zymae TaxID=267363 RepID=UPI0028B77811|nr:iron reductase [Levilactobacillus zymae]MDT6980580.1 iron reductase [Levilactobacillus zymae]